jgi:tetratricopeptide (TPR) repeat protein
LFISYSAGLDTTELVPLLESAREQLAIQETRLRYDEFVDSATAKIKLEDYLAARYFAGLALAELPASQQAQELLQEAQQAIDLSATNENLIEEGLRRVDSVLARDLIEEALLTLRALRQLAPEHSGVRLALARLEVERWRRAAYAAYGRGDYETALDALDSVAAVFPECSWCKTLPREIERRLEQEAEEPPPSAIGETRQLSKAERHEVEAAYHAAQQSFEQGDLGGAIAQWETVENLAPDYREVRRYLVSAYKFVGIELYGKKQREEALETWRKAIALDPGNSELRDYITRTESELRKLRELSYER